jgi:hypothetical protein
MNDFHWPLADSQCFLMVRCGSYHYHAHQEEFFLPLHAKELGVPVNEAVFLVNTGIRPLSALVSATARLSQTVYVVKFPFMNSFLPI